jgi:hypothetical protein
LEDREHSEDLLLLIGHSVSIHSLLAVAIVLLVLFVFLFPTWNAPLKLNRDGQSLVQPIRFMVDE